MACDKQQEEPTKMERQGLRAKKYDLKRDRSQQPLECGDFIAVTRGKRNEMQCRPCRH